VLRRTPNPDIAAQRGQSYAAQLAVWIAPKPWQKSKAKKQRKKILKTASCMVVL
jgi:murein endopeptidase